ncbi:hypothetical protein [Nocardia tengchongensis]|uniref:hypothetical protein n=1 Tax=Nocardia tengchongensis TaxID=2055889 RepID=UPI00368F3ED0
MRDRTGEEVDEQPAPHDPRCDGSGWIDRDADNPVPCLVCKDHLLPKSGRRQRA